MPHSGKLDEPLFLLLDLVSGSSLQYGRVSVKGVVGTFVLPGHVLPLVPVLVLAYQD